MKKKAVIFGMQKKNFYSFTPLIAIIEEDKELKDLAIFIEKEINAAIIKKYLHKYEEILIAMSFRTAQLAKTYQVMSEVYTSLSSDDLRRIIFIAGGSHPTGDPKSTLKIGFDYVFISEAEYSFTFFLKQWLSDMALKNTPGIAYWEQFPDIIKINKSPPLINLDDYPMLAKKRKLYPPLEITRGCAFRCSFCQVPSLFQGKVRHRSPEVILDTVKWMGENYLDDIRFITPNSFGYLSKKPKEVNDDAIIYLLTQIKSTPGIKRVFFGTFPGEVRPETVSESLIKNIKPLIANNKIAIGLQSGSNRVLSMHHRGHTVEDGLNAIYTIKKYGFTPIVDFILGLPGATEEDEIQSIDIMKQLISIGAKIRPHVFMPLPGTKLANAPVGTTTKLIRKKLGMLTFQKKIEGNWSYQERYARESWLTMKEIENRPIIHKETKKSSR